MARTFIRTSDLASGSIIASLLAADAVETAKIKDLNVTSGKLADGSVLEAKLASGSVTEGKIGSGAVTAAKIGAGAVETAKLADAAVTEGKIGSAAVTAAKIGSGAVETEKLAALAVTAAKLADGSVETAKIGAGAVTEAKLADGAIATAKIAAGAVTSAKLASDSVGTSALIGASVTTAKLASAAVTADKADLTGEWTFGAGKLKTSMAATPADGDVVTKGYLDSFAQGIQWKASVRALNIYAGAFDATTVKAGDTYGGVTLADGDRFVAMGISPSNGTGVFVAGTAASYRAPDFDAPNEIRGAAVFVREGTYADRQFILVTDTASITIGTTAIQFNEVASVAQLTAGNGLSKSGTTLDVNVGNGVQIVSDAVALKLNASNPGLSVDANGLVVLRKANGGVGVDGGGIFVNAANGVQVDGGGFVSVKLNATNPALSATGDGLSVLVDGADAIETSGTGLKVKSGGISAAKLAANAVETAKINDGAVTYDKLAADVKAAIGKADHGMTFLASANQTTFDLAHSDVSSGFGGHQVFLNGRLQLIGAGNDYTFSDNTGTGGVDQIVFTFALSADDFVAVCYGRAA
jgi:hypothetical protein